MKYKEINRKMKKDIGRKALALALVGTSLAGGAGAADLGNMIGLSIPTAIVAEAAPKIQSNVSTQRVSKNLSEGSLPGSAALAAGNTYFINLAATIDNQLKACELWVKFPGDSSFTRVGTFTANNFFRYTSFSVTPKASGTLQYYFKIKDKNTGKWTTYKTNSISVSGTTGGSGSASSYSSGVNAAVQWCQAQVGRSIDYDGAYGAQCVDLIKAYYHYLGKNPVRGNGKDYASNSLPSGFRRLKGVTPQPGDVIIYTTGSWGHVAIMGFNGESYHQNYNGVQKVVKVTKNPTTCRGGYWGVIRPF